MATKTAKAKKPKAINSEAAALAANHVPGKSIEVRIGPAGDRKRSGLMWLPESEADFFRIALRAGVGSWVGWGWHETDQIDLDAVTTGTVFNNAGYPEYEKTVHLKIDGKRVASVNLATLCALATGAVMNGLKKEDL